MKYIQRAHQMINLLMCRINCLSTWDDQTKEIDILSSTIIDVATQWSISQEDREDGKGNHL